MSGTKHDKPGFWGLKEAAEYIGCSEHALRNWAKAGKIPAFRDDFTGKWYIAQGIAKEYKPLLQIAIRGPRK